MDEWLEHAIDEGDECAIWRKPWQTMVHEGQRLRFLSATKNWYRGRCSIALTYHSRIEFPEREPYWKE